MATLAETLDERTRVGDLYATLEDGSVRCVACGLRCLIRPGRRGVCRVRYNDEYTLRVPTGYVAALQCDPIEKKPFFHVFPGSDSMTFGMLGCDFHCSYCQNWVTSQALKDGVAGVGPHDVSAEDIAELAVQRGARLVVSSYNEPFITAEWARDVFEHARARNLHTALVSNGNATPEVLDYLKPWLDAYKIDLKTMSDRKYRKLGGVLENVLDSVRHAHDRGYWIEVVTLVVPGFNDSDDELRDAAAFIASVSPHIPWHVIAFRQDFKMQDAANTQPADLIRAAEIGKTAGLDFVYAGNLPEAVDGWENTHCPQCDHLLIERNGFVVLKDEASPNRGCCPRCENTIPGLWPA
jgi:pyruvate formate lyase activating enzyme